MSPLDVLIWAGVVLAVALVAAFIAVVVFSVVQEMHKRSARPTAKKEATDATD